ncbi:hypothetical protein LIER_01821 [Lithospermum erythrorhizon]|uniref:Uncharacterized protein n=1 Tax=Lithospermum erythrorhizon TaxID=34254 RepID=A0AAV3NMF5_LITER
MYRIISLVVTLVLFVGCINEAPVYGRILLATSNYIPGNGIVGSSRNADGGSSRNLASSPVSFRGLNEAVHPLSSGPSDKGTGH